MHVSITRVINRNVISPSLDWFFIRIVGSRYPLTPRIVRGSFLSLQCPHCFHESSVRLFPFVPEYDKRLRTIRERIISPVLIFPFCLRTPFIPFLPTLRVRRQKWITQGWALTRQLLCFLSLPFTPLSVFLLLSPPDNWESMRLYEDDAVVLEWNYD